MAATHCSARCCFSKLGINEAHTNAPASVCHFEIGRRNLVLLSFAYAVSEQTPLLVSFVFWCPLAAVACPVDHAASRFVGTPDSQCYCHGHGFSVCKGQQGDGRSSEFRIALLQRNTSGSPDTSCQHCGWHAALILLLYAASVSQDSGERITLRTSRARVYEL